MKNVITKKVNIVTPHNYCECNHVKSVIFLMIVWCNCFSMLVSLSSLTPTQPEFHVRICLSRKKCWTFDKPKDYSSTC